MELRKPRLLFFCGQRLGTGLKGVLPNVLADDVLVFVRDVYVNGVVAVGTGDGVNEIEPEHLRMLAQMPDVRFVARKARAVNTRLLPRAHTDGLTVFCIADGVRLRVFERDERNHEVTLGAVGQVFVFRNNVLKRAFVDLQRVAALLKGDAEHVLVLDGRRLVICIDLYNVVIALFLGFEDLQRLGLVAGGDDAVGHFMLNKLRRRHVANVGKRDPVAERGHTVRAAGARISRGEGRKLESIVNPVDFPKRVRKRQTDRRARRADVLERGCCGKAQCGFQLAHQLPAVKSV